MRLQYTKNNRKINKIVPTQDRLIMNHEQNHHSVCCYKQQMSKQECFMNGNIQINIQKVYSNSIFK